MGIAEILSLIPALVRVAEMIFGAKTGVQKKQAVVETAQVIIEKMQEHSKGGQKETWDKYGALIEQNVDAIAGALYPKLPDESEVGRI